MKRKRHTPEQIIRKLRTAEQLLNQGQTVADVCRTLEVSAAHLPPLAAALRRHESHRGQAPQGTGAGEQSGLSDCWLTRSSIRRCSRSWPRETSEPGTSPQSRRGSAGTIPGVPAPCLPSGGPELVISDAHVGLTKAIRRMLQGCCWQRCRVHFARNLLQRVPKAHQGMVTAALRSVFSQEDAIDLVERWDDLAASLVERFPRAAELMDQAREDVLAFRHFPQQHWKKVWSTNLLERLNEEIKRRTRVVGIFPNDASITRLVGAVLLEQDEHWQLEGRRMFSAESMAAIPALEEPACAGHRCRKQRPELRPQVIAP